MRLPRNAIITESRAPWPMSPCSARTLWPRRLRSSASFCVPILVRAKMIVVGGFISSMKRSSSSSLSRPSAYAMRCVTVSTVISLEAILTYSGLCSSSSANFLIGSGIVALNSAVCLPHGVRFMMSRTSSMKPIESISSASSRTTMRQSARIILPRRRRSRTRPGVPTTIWPPRLSAVICSTIGAPP